MDSQTVTLEEIRTWPAVVPMEDAARALRISKSHGHALAKEGKFPCRVVPLGTSTRVVTASLLALLEEPTAERNREEVTAMGKHSPQKQDKNQGSTPPVKGGPVD